MCLVMVRCYFSVIADLMVIIIIKYLYFIRHHRQRNITLYEVDDIMLHDELLWEF